MLKNGFLNHKFNDEGISHFWAKYLMNNISNDFSNELLKFPTQKTAINNKNKRFQNPFILLELSDQAQIIIVLKSTKSTQKVTPTIRFAQLLLFAIFSSKMQF